LNNNGDNNTASGVEALYNNTKGSTNTASGVEALYSNINGNDNTAVGANALHKATGNADNSASNENTASGSNAMFNNTLGNDNTASGFDALYNNNTTGSDNTASGVGALYFNTTGSSNVALGNSAGENITAGSNNIDIGVDATSTGDESNTIRIGTLGKQKKTFIAGISGTTVSGADVVVSSTGQLGIVTSSARYKHDIHDMGGASAGLMKLRPVTFRYKSDPTGTLQYGLVAEEVARVYPELVVRGSDGKVQSVRYLELTALLLNELQKQTAKVAAEQREIDALKQQNASINTLSERLAVLEQQVHAATAQGLRSLASK
jgi:Chaperone of endosialidase